MFRVASDGELNTVDDTNPNVAIADGQWNFACTRTPAAGTAIPQQVRTFEGISLLEVRMVFGSEDDERFNWEQNVIIP